MKNSAEIKESTQDFRLCPYQTTTDSELLSDFTNFVQQQNYRPSTKLMCDLTNKQKHMLYYRMFKFYLEQGMKKGKMYRYKQSPLLATYIGLNTSKQTKAKTKFEKVSQKLMNNAFVGKTAMENVSDRVNLDLIDHSQIDQILEIQSKLKFKDFVDHYSTFSVHKFDDEKIVFDKPFYLGFTVLELSKLFKV